VVRLPVLTGEARATPPVQPAQAIRSTGRHRILVVDDNVDAAESLALLLRLEGHDAQTAYTGLAALAALQADSAEVVILDLGMPGMDGFSIAR
jgi:two-component system CheB/CheR fusion protein